MARGAHVSTMHHPLPAPWLRPRHVERRPVLERLPRSLTLGLAALVISLCAPVGLWLIWRLSGPGADLESLRRASLLYVAATTSGLFGVFGVMVGRLVDQLVATREKLALEAREDGLTGLANRREFSRRLQMEILRRNRTGEPLSLIMLDVDHFKSVNDIHGHGAGDAVLRQVATQIHACCRAVDLPARYGGEEFAVIAPGLPAEDAAQVAERIRAQVEAAVTGFAALTLHVTISAGVATAEGEGVTTEELLRRSDEELLRAKRTGRNVVCSTVRPRG